MTDNTNEPWAVNEPYAQEHLRLFTNTWLPLALGTNAATYKNINPTLLRDLHPQIHNLGPHHNTTNLPQLIPTIEHELDSILTPTPLLDTLLNLALEYFNLWTDDGFTLFETPDFRHRTNQKIVTHIPGYLDLATTTGLKTWLQNHADDDDYLDGPLGLVSAYIETHLTHDLLTGRPQTKNLLTHYNHIRTTWLQPT